jgi:hypothetical protein
LSEWFNDLEQYLPLTLWVRIPLGAFDFFMPESYPASLRKVVGSVGKLARA